jgi:hypothetical protein
MDKRMHSCCLTQEASALDMRMILQYLRTKLQHNTHTPC